MQSKNPTQLDIAEMLIHKAISKYPLMAHLVKMTRFSDQYQNVEPEKDEIIIQLAGHKVAIFIMMNDKNQLIIGSPVAQSMKSGDWKRSKSVGGRRIVDLPWVYDNIYEPSFVGQFSADISGLIYKLVKQIGNRS